MLFLFAHCLVPYYLIISLQIITIMNSNLPGLFLYYLFGYANTLNPLLFVILLS